MHFFDMNTLLERLLDALIQQYPGPVGLGLFVIVVMIIGTLTLTVAIMYEGIRVPFVTVKSLLQRRKDE